MNAVRDRETPAHLASKCHLLAQAQLPKELRRAFLTPFKPDTDIHSSWASHKHPAWVGEHYETWTWLDQQDTLHPGTAASPAVGTTNHPRENHSSQQAKETAKLKAEIVGNSFLLMFRGEL